ncbi:MAG TPA: glycosyltransferase family 4 protein [Dongiaceae bacterium]|nr:glycosyltransferase family 4 protein [Dongiaceae bacterium]
MKIAMIGSRGIGSNYGGIERVLDELCPRLVALGHEVDVFSRPGPAVEVPPGLRAIPVAACGGKHFENISRSALATLRAIGRYDVVHFHATGPGILSLATKVTGQKSVVTIHALDQQREKWGLAARAILQAAERCVVTCADEITVVSESLRRYLRERYDRRAIHIPNGLPKKARIPAGDLLTRHGLTPGKYFLFASRLTPEKGCHDLIAAFNTLDTDIKLAIAGGVGPADYLAQLRQRVDPRRVAFLGHLAQDELGEAFSNATAFVLPSYIEGMSMALLEAIAYRLPVLVSDIDANALVVGNNGLTFRTGDIGDLSNRLRQLAETPERGLIADAAMLPDWQQVADRYDHLYRRLARRPGTIGAAKAE